MPTEVFDYLGDLLEAEGIAPTGVVHIGAHLGQEVGSYIDAGFDLIRLVEPNSNLWPMLFERFKATESVQVIGVACGAGSEKSLHVTAWDERSSTLRPIDYRVSRILKVPVEPLWKLQDGCNVAVLDCQGSELEVLQSGRLDLLDVAVVETSERVRYHDAPTRRDVQDYMVAQGHQLATTFARGHSPGIRDEVWLCKC